MSIVLTLNTPNDGDRFNQLTNLVPGGSFYSSGGMVLPYRNTPTPFILTTTFPNTRFAVVINGVISGYTTTDGSGNADVNIQLPLGECSVEIQREFSTDKITKTFTTREYAVWQAAIAEQITNIDDSIKETLDSFYLASAQSGDIDLAHGTLLRTQNISIEELEAYRNTLQEIQQSFRQYAGIESGKFGIVSALTSINPLIFNRYKDGKRWVLGYDRCINGNLVETTRFPTSSLVNINDIPGFISLGDVDNYVNVGTDGSLTYNHYFRRFLWSPPTAPTLLYPWIFSWKDLFIDHDRVLTNGTYTIRSPRALNYIDSLFISTVTPTLGEYDKLYINIDKHGIVQIDAYLSQSLNLDMATIINAFIASDERYRLHKIATPGAGVLVPYIELLEVSYSTLITSGAFTGTIKHVSGSDYQYQSPTGAYGAVTHIDPDTIGTIPASDGYTITILTGRFVPPPNVTATFTISQKYSRIATLVNTNRQVRILSQNVTYRDGISETSILSGPANFASFPLVSGLRGLFDIPKVTTNLAVAANPSNTTVSVTAGSSSNFCGNGPQPSQVPFDAVVGHGYRSVTITSFTIAPDTDPNTAVFEITAGGTFSDGDSYLVVDFSTVGNRCFDGTHKILGIIDGPTNKKVRIAYGGTVSNQPVTITGVHIIHVDPSTPNLGNTGALSFTFPTNTLEWQSPDAGDGYGAPINVGAGGYFTITSVLGYYIDVLVDSTAIPGSIQVDNIRIAKFRSYTSAGGESVKVWCSGEKVTVTGVTAGANDVWQLNTPILGKYDINMLVCHPDIMGITQNDRGSFGTIDINVLSVGDATPGTDVVSVIGSKLPDGWIATMTGTPYEIPDMRINDVAVYVDDTTAADAIITRSIPITNDLLNTKLTLRTWIRNLADVSGTNESFKLGFNFGSGWIESSALNISSPDSTIRQPHYLEFSQILPSSATDLQIRIKRLAATPVRYSIERVILSKGNTEQYGLFMGDGTIPRTSGISQFGDVVCVWSPDILFVEEKELLGCGPLFTTPINTMISVVWIEAGTMAGVGTLFYDGITRNITWAPPGEAAGPATIVLPGTGIVWTSLVSLSGLTISIRVNRAFTDIGILPVTITYNTAGRIQDAHNAMEITDAIDVTDPFSNGTAVSGVLGIVGSTWASATLTNMELVTRSPARFSYVKPTKIGMIYNESLTFSISPPYDATLLITNDQTQAGWTLYENGIPVPQDQWSIVGPLTIRVLSGFDQTSVYTVDYKPLIMAMSNTIDLQQNGIPLDVWFADAAVWNRNVDEINAFRETISITFSPNFTATLIRRSDQNKLASVLTEDTGVSRRTIPSENWSYIDSGTISINGAEFNIDAIYTLTYNQEILKLSRAATIIREIRGGTSIPNMLAASYLPFNINDTIDTTLRYFQIRVKISDITDLRDIRLYSMILKGMDFDKIGF